MSPSVAASASVVAAPRSINRWAARQFLNPARLPAARRRPRLRDRASTGASMYR